VSDLHDALSAIDRDYDARVVILTGAGRGFCAGFDLEDAGPELGPEGIGDVQRVRIAMREFYGLITRIRRLRQPIVAAVNGAAAGGGFALTLAADVRVAADSARFAASFIRVGYSACDIAVSYLLPRLVGGARANEIMLTGRLLDAEEAYRIGLVHEVTSGDALMAAADRVADNILRNSPLGVEMTKEVMHLNVDAPSLEAAIALEQRTNALTIHTEDRSEAIAAWLEKRPPNFHYR
jgi:enoyl-CoA hydratase